MRKYGKPPSRTVLTHVKREIIQKVWELLLDDDFSMGLSLNVQMVHSAITSPDFSLILQITLKRERLVSIFTETD